MILRRGGLKRATAKKTGGGVADGGGVVRPLYLDRFRRANADGEARYVAGERSGLTLVKVL